MDTALVFLLSTFVEAAKGKAPFLIFVNGLLIVSNP